MNEDCEYKSGRCEIITKLKKALEEKYKEGFRAGLEACKKNPKLDKAIAEGTEL